MTLPQQGMNSEEEFESRAHWTAKGYDLYQKNPEGGYLYLETRCRFEGFCLGMIYATGLEAKLDTLRGRVEQAQTSLNEGGSPELIAMQLGSLLQEMQ